MVALGDVSATQQAEIKSAIYSHLKENEVFSSLKAIVGSVLGGQTSEALAAAQHKSVVAAIARSEAGAGLAVAADAAATGKTLLHVLLLGGRAFTAEPEDDATRHPDAGDSLSVCLQFGAQRFRSKPAPFASEPALRDGVLFELPPPDAAGAKAASKAALPSEASLERLRGTFRSTEPMHLLVLKRQASDGREVLLSSCMLEWRQVLHQGKTSLAIELPGVGAQATLPVGSLELQMELLPSPPSEGRMTEAEVVIGLKKEREMQVDAERKFFAYARTWWQQYVNLSPSHSTRPVKLFALSELGTQRPVTAFLTPLRGGRHQHP